MPRWLTPGRIAAAAFALAAVALVSGAIGTSALPTRCGQVGRPTLDSTISLALTCAAVAILVGLYGLIRMKTAWALRFVVAAVAGAEIAAWIVVFLYHRHHVPRHWDNCL